MFKLQNDFANLQSDYSATLDNMQQEVSEFYAANPVNADVFKDSMKEYGLGNLFAKDVNDAFAGILLAAPTLVNSDWALEAQKRLNRGLSVCIFPEGGVPYDESIVLDTFKDGAFRLAIEHQIPIVP